MIYDHFENWLWISLEDACTKTFATPACPTKAG